MKIKQSSELSPIFITGVWRSGTTLVSRILNNHKDLEITYDTVHFLRFSFDRFNPIGEIDNVRNLVNEINDRIKTRYCLELSVEDILLDLGETKTYASIYDAVMTNFLLKGKDSKVWGEKTNLAWSKIPAFFNMFPDGRVIQVIRDPRAVLSSWKKFTNAPGNDYLDSIMNCHHSMCAALKYSQQYADHRYIYITYEDLVRSPVETTKSICEKFKLDYQECMLNHEAFTDRHGKGWSANTVYNESITGISSRLINKWMDELNKWEIALVDNITASLYDKFGYSQTENEIDTNLADTIIQKILESKLTSDGFIRYLITGEGIERYPTDPMDKSNWNTVGNMRNKKKQGIDF